MDFITKIKTKTSDGKIEDLLDRWINYLENRIQEQELQGAGWNIKYIANIDLNIFKFKNSLGKSYILLPKQLQYHKILNIPNDDNLCLIY